MRLQANPPILQSGNDLRIGHIDDPELRRNISISYELVVPPNTRLQSHTGSGNQTVSGLQGRVEVGTGSGSLTISDNGDMVRADTGSGSIEIDRAKGSVRAKTGSGSIQASGIAGGFEGDTGSGDVQAGADRPRRGARDYGLRQYRTAGSSRIARRTNRQRVAGSRRRSDRHVETAYWVRRSALAHGKQGFVRPGRAHQFRLDFFEPAHHGPRHHRPQRGARQGEWRWGFCGC